MFPFIYTKIILDILLIIENHSAEQTTSRNIVAMFGNTNEDARKPNFVVKMSDFLVSMSLSSCVALHFFTLAHVRYVYPYRHCHFTRPAHIVCFFDPNSHIPNVLTRMLFLKCCFVVRQQINMYVTYAATYRWYDHYFPCCSARCFRRFFAFCWRK